MRLVGLLMALIGGLMLGYQGVTYVTTRTGAEGPGAETPVVLEYHVPPVVSGIVLVTGLLVVASTGRRDPS